MILMFMQSFACGMGHPPTTSAGNATVLKVELYHKRMGIHDDIEVDRLSCAVVRDDSGGLGVHQFLHVDPTPRVGERVCAAVLLRAGEPMELSCAGARHPSIYLVQDPASCVGRDGFFIEQ